MNCDERLRASRAVGLTWSLLLALIAPTLAHGTVYKCQGEQGVIQYQEAPCLIGRELRNFDTDPPPLSVVPRLADPSAEAAPATRSVPDAASSAKPVPAPKVAAVPAHSGHSAKGTGDASARRFIREGMTEGDVLAAIGPPDATANSNGKSRGNGRWSYLPTAGDPDTVTTITFAAGTVSAVSRKVIRK